MRTARFHEIRDRAVTIVDRVFAQPLRHSPMRGGVKDPERPQHEFEAPLRTGAGKARAPEGGGGKAWSTEIASGLTTVRIDLRTYTGPAFHQGDRIRDLTVEDGLYEVARIDDRDSNRLVLELNEA